MINSHHSKTNRSVLLSTFAILGLMCSCAHDDVQKGSLAANANLPQELVNVESRLNNDRNQQMDIAAPTTFKKAEDHFADARKAQQKGKDRDLRTEIEWTNAYLDRSELLASTGATELAPVLTARQAAIKADAPTVSPKEFTDADKKLKDVTKKVTPNGTKFSAKDLTDAQQAYLNAELVAIKTRKLAEANALVKNAVDMGAKRYAPKTLANTQVAISNAERTIETDRHNNAVVDQSVEVANQQAHKLVDIVHIARNSRSPAGAEAIALDTYNRNSQLNMAEGEIQKTEKEKADLAAKMKEQQQATTSENRRMGMAIADLRDQNENLKDQNEELSNKEDLNEAMAKAQSEFSPKEAEVYQQGDKLVIRLKSMNFGSSKADIPPSALPSLKKVKDVIGDLDAKKVTVEGHTDSIGQSEINREVSQKRADAVKDYLVTEGAVAESKVESIGMGDEKPITTNKTAAGRKENRRVDIIVEPSTTL